MLLNIENPVFAPTYTDSSHTLFAQIGNTPLLRLDKIARAHAISADVTILAKAEWFNPGGSVKDRPAFNIIRTAEREGQLQPGMTLLDATSGNTGIAYAMLGAARGYQVKLIMPANVSPERIAVLKAYGAELTLTPPEEGADGAIRVARQLANDNPAYFYADQYNNDANWQAHYYTTANEIWQQTEGQITHFVAGMGTSGTFMGTTRRLRELNPQITAVSGQPDTAQDNIRGWKHMPTAIVPGIYDETLADSIVTIRTTDAHQMARALARTEGLFVGVSAAAAVLATLQVARDLSAGVVVTVLPDSGFKYVSETFWTEPDTTD